MHETAVQHCMASSLPYYTFATALCACCVQNGLQCDPVSCVIPELPSSPRILPTTTHRPQYAHLTVQP